MERAFDVQIGADSGLLKGYNVIDFEERKKKAKEQLRKIICANQEIEAKKIKQLLLPTNFEYDIFISHSHNDVELAKQLAGFIEKTFNLKCFIDSIYWSNIEALEEELNELHKVGNLYDHKKTMNVAKHANIILASALTEMIDKCKCVFFLNTENSVIEGKNVLNLEKSTYSPWIYHEIYTVNLLNKYIRNTSYLKFYESFPNITYDLDLSGMARIDKTVLNKWKQNYNIVNQEALEILYKLVKSN